MTTPYIANERQSQKKESYLFAKISVIVLGFTLISPILRGAKGLDWISFLFILAGSFGVWMLWVSMIETPYSLKQVHWVFYVTFFSVTPLFQYQSSTWPWGYRPLDTQILRTILLVIMWGIIFALVSGRRESCFLERDNRIWTEKKMTFELTQAARIILPLGCIISLIILVSVIGIENMFLRTTNKVDIDSSSLRLSISVCLRAFVFGSFALLSLNARRTRKYYFGVLISAVCLLLTCFPTAIPRFNVAVIYLGLAVLSFSSFTKRKGMFSFFLITGFLVAYPLFNAFKYIGSGESIEDIFNAIIDSMHAGYVSGNYDAFSIMFWCLDYLSRFGNTAGVQLIGSILFFVPRTLWESKPVPSGELVFSSFNYPFTDIAFPLPFEGCINFGIIGLPIFALVYGFIVRTLDYNYWKDRFNYTGGIPSTLLIYYPFLLCLSFYMLRGAMMTTFTYVFGDLAVMSLLHHFAKFMKNPREKYMR